MPSSPGPPCQTPRRAPSYLRGEGQPRHLLSSGLAWPTALLAQLTVEQLQSHLPSVMASTRRHAILVPRSVGSPNIPNQAAARLRNHAPSRRLGSPLPIRATTPLPSRSYSPANPPAQDLGADLGLLGLDPSATLDWGIVLPSRLTWRKTKKFVGLPKGLSQRQARRYV